MVVIWIEDDGLSLHQQLRNKEAREILGMGGKWQDMARYYGKIQLAFISFITLCELLCRFLGVFHFTHMVSREEDGGNIDLSTLKRDLIQADTHPVYFTPSWCDCNIWLASQWKA